MTLSLFFDPSGCTWDVRSSVNGSDFRMVGMDFTKAPTGAHSDMPWADTVIADLIEKAWWTAYSEQQVLPFP